MPKRRGVDGRMAIRPTTGEGNNEWTFLGYQRLEFNDRTTILPVTDSELKPGNPNYEAKDDTITSGRNDRFVAKIGDLREGMLRFVNATWSEEANPFGPPLRIRSGEFYEVIIAPVRAFIDFPESCFHLGNMVCANAGQTWVIPGAQPVNLDFETDGSFRLPAELEGL